MSPLDPRHQVTTSSQPQEITEIIKNNPATFGLIFIMSLIYFLDVVTCFLNLPCHLFILLFAQGNQLVWEGQVWRLVTAMFVHGDVIHWLSNMLFLLIYGLRLEELKGSRWVVFIFLLSGFTGNVISLIIMKPEIISLGASGGVFGILGALLVTLRRLYPSQARAMIFLAIIFFILTISVGTNIFSHFGGLASGSLLMYLETRLLNLNDQKRKKIRF